MVRKMRLDDKAKTGDEQVTLIEVILDESGSMDGIVSDTLGGLNGYIRKQKEQVDGGLARFSLTTFSAVGEEFVRTIVDNMPIDQVKPITGENYNPYGGTPLLDAVGQRITEVETLLNSYKVRPEVLFAVITDGLENQSKKYTKDDIQKMISGREGKGWTFVFMGANQDAWGESQQYGYVAGNTVGWEASAGGVAVAYDTLSSSTRAFRSAGSVGTQTFFEEPDTTPNPETESPIAFTKKKTTRPSSKRRSKDITSKK